MAKTRLTGFARLFLFLLIFLPTAFFGISYYKGEDGLANLREMVGLENNAAGDAAQVPADVNTSDVQALRDRITELSRRLAITEEKLARCETQGVD